MVDKPKIRRREICRYWFSIKMHLRKRKISCLAPDLNVTLNCRCPEEVGALRGFWSFITLTWNVHVITSAAVLGAVPTSHHKSADDHRGAKANTQDKVLSKERRLLELWRIQRRWLTIEESSRHNGYVV